MSSRSILRNSRFLHEPFWTSTGKVKQLVKPSKILQLFHENSRFPPSFKFWSVSAIQKHWEEVKKCILHGF
jgi:hypothetical protein